MTDPTPTDSSISDREAAAKALHDNTGFRNPHWDGEADGVRERCRIQADAVLALLQSRGRLMPTGDGLATSGEIAEALRISARNLRTSADNFVGTGAAAWGLKLAYRLERSAAAIEAARAAARKT